MVGAAPGLVEARSTALGAFYSKWEKEPLVLLKWLALQARLGGATCLGVCVWPRLPCCTLLPCAEQRCAAPCAVGIACGVLGAARLMAGPGKQPWQATQGPACGACLTRRRRS